MNQILLVGPPNAGKTTLFNWLTGSSFRTVNYAGATVEYSTGGLSSHLFKNESLGSNPKLIAVTDTPGIRSLHPLSPDEIVTAEHLFSVAQKEPTVVVAVVDATQLTRHLFLVEQLKKCGFTIVVAVTMVDLLRKSKASLHLHQLSQDFDCPFVAVEGLLGGGVQEVVKEAQNLFLKQRSSQLNQQRNQQLNQQLNQEPLSWDTKKIQSVYQTLDEKSDRWITFIHSKGPKVDTQTLKLDRIFLHPVWGLFIFIMVMATLFASIFWAAAPVMELVDSSLSGLSEWIISLGEHSLLSDFLGNAVVTGFSAFLVFVPQIFILFLLMGFLEDTGYLARAATLVDRPLSKIGLNGRSFLPLLSGYACAIPGVLSSRTIASRKERLLTIFILPLMSCSARLPVYALLLSFLFYGKNPFYAGLALTAIYILSMILGSVVAAIMARVIRLKEKSYFLLELPTYRQPKIKVTLRQAWSRTSSFIFRAGPVILTVAIVIWVGTTFPEYKLENKSERLAASYASQLGQRMNPVWKPMGLDWRAGVGLMSAFAAREVFVSTLALLYHIDSEDKESVRQTLVHSMQEAKFEDGSPIFTTRSVLGLVIFFMISLQCFSTVAVVRKESGIKGFAFLQLTLFTLTAYVLAVLIQHV